MASKGLSFKKVKGKWVDANGNAAPKDLIPILEKEFSKESETTEAMSEDKPSLPVASAEKNIDDESLKKLTKTLEDLKTVVEKLTKKLESDTKRDNQDTSKPAERVYEPGKIPTVTQAVKSNVKEFFGGTRDKYGQTTDPGFLRTITGAGTLGVSELFFKGIDRKRKVIAEELKDYESTLDPSLSKKEKDRKVQEKRAELENSKPAKPEQAKPAKPERTPEQAKPAKPEQAKPATPERTPEQASAIAEGKELAAPDVDTKIQSVKIEDISDSAVKKITDAVLGKKEEPKDKKLQEKEQASPKSGGSGSIFDNIKDMFDRRRGGAKGAATKVEKEAEQLLDKNGKPLRGAAKASREAKLAKEAAESAEQVAKKPSILSRILGGGAKAAETGVARVAERQLLNPKNILRLGKGVAGGVGSIAGGLALDYASEKLTESGHEKLGAAANIGSDALTGAGLGATIGSVVPGVGTVIGGAVGGAAGGLYGLWKNRKTLFGQQAVAQSKPPAIMARAVGTTPQTQALDAGTKRVEAARMATQAPAPTIVNNNVNAPSNVSSSQPVIGGNTVADRGSLDLNSF